MRAWKLLSPYVDFNFIDTGKATAQVGSVAATAQADTFLFSSGVRLSSQHSRLRPYVQFGGGFLYQSLSASLNLGGGTASDNAKGTVGALNYGAGLQVFAGKRWGFNVDLGGYHFASPLGLTGGSNSAGVRAGFFYQTKSSIE